ncbi:MAG: isoprenylcysteine carboxylmethyltransferase family protein [Phycisphaerae bacterium]
MTFKTKVYLSFLSIPVCFGALIFLPAWTLDFWQGWVYIATWGVTTFLMCVYMVNKDPQLLRRRFKSREPRTRQLVFMIAIRAAFVAPLVIAGFDHRLGWSHVPLAIQVVGQVVMLGGMLGIFETIRENTFAATTVTVEPGQRVISTGLYSIVRHPMYAAAMLTQIATPVALASWWGFPAIGVGIAAVVLRILDEEKLLAAELPGYTQYRSVTRWRLIPRIW